MPVSVTMLLSLERLIHNILVPTIFFIHIEESEMTFQGLFNAILAVLLWWNIFTCPVTIGLLSSEEINDAILGH